jgi:zinc transport system permease protein
VESILLNAFLAGAVIAIVAAPLGCFIVWRRLAYFSDTLSHSALLGIAMGILWQFNLVIAVIGTSFTLAIFLLFLQRQQWLSNDTLLGILAHSSLALGMITISLLDNVRVDVLSYLFGDLLTINREELIWMYSGGAILLLFMIKLWRPLLTATVHEDLARVEGLPVERLRLALMLMLALVIAVAMKIVGVLLISALLIIPAATARRFSSSPEMMAILAALIGLCAVANGLSGAYYWDLPAGPSVVVAAASLFFLVQLIPKKQN